jgi:serine/threonine protein phosphatase PrpC
MSRRMKTSGRGVKMAESALLESEVVERISKHLTATESKLVEWQVIGETIAGASHLRVGRPNQDAILQVRESGVYAPIVLSLSDGHGSNKCFRSHRGSRFAVTIGAQLMCELIDEKRKGYDAAKIENAVKEIFPLEFVRRWQAVVQADLTCDPFTKEELGQVEAVDSMRARELVEAHPALAYGATTLTVAVTSSFVIYAQLGDGEIMLVLETGEVSKPLPEDDRLLANETTSLCTDTAADDFRTAYHPFTQSLPALIVMTTDGYANSFVDEAGFLKVGNDLLNLLRADGFDTVNRSVKGWLEEATRLGSGDDCTLGIICRMDALKPVSTSPLVRVQEDKVQEPASQVAAEEVTGNAGEPSEEKH